MTEIKPNVSSSRPSGVSSPPKNIFQNHRNSAIHVRDGDEIDGYMGHQQAVAAQRQLQGIASVIGNPTKETEAMEYIVSATLKKGMQLTSENSGVMTKNRDTIVD